MRYSLLHGSRCLRKKIAHQLASIGHLQSENCISNLESAHLRRQTYKKDAYVPQKMSLLQVLRCKEKRTT